MEQETKMIEFNQAKGRNIGGVVCYPIPEVVRVCGVTDRTVRTMLTDGRLKSAKLGNQTWVTLESIQALFK